jgi:hypothetical protein
MGGSAFVVYGEVENRCFEPVPIKKNILDILLFRQRFTKPTMTLIGDKYLVDIPLKDPKSIVRCFKDYLKRKINQPWTSTQYFLDYLNMGVISPYLRGETRGSLDQGKYYFQISFSSCSGMAYVLADLGFHWTSKWFSEEREAIAKNILEPIGFKMNDEINEPEKPMKFLPVAELGYALWHSNEPNEDSEWEGSRLFEFDASFLEILDAEKLKECKELDQKYGDMFVSGGCKCQICAPDFKPIIF